MFTYLNPDIRQQLTKAGKLVRINRSGVAIDENKAASAGELIINLLGPIPLPLKMSGQSYQANWYAAVRSTELEKVEELASTLRDSGGQNLFASLAWSFQDSHKHR